LALAGFASAQALQQDPITIRMMAGGGWGIPAKEATDPRSLARRAVFEAFHRKHPDIRVVNAGGLDLAGPRAESFFLMSMAGDTAPDIIYVNFRQYYNYIEQGFLRPLDDLIARTPGALDRVHPEIMEVVTSYDGKMYAMPWFQVAQGLYYRKDHFIEAGLNPNRPPKDWDEFYQYAQKLVESRQGRVGFAFSRGAGYHWSNFVWQAGGEIVVPAGDGTWKSAIDSPEAATALDFFRKLTVNRWQTADGRTAGPAAEVTATFGPDIASGKVSMWFAYTNDIVLNMSDIDPSVLGFGMMPAGPAGHANEVNAGMWAINASITDPAKIEACWKFIQYFASDEAARVNTEQFVEMGLGPLVNPVLLEKFGYEDLASAVDPAFVQANIDLFRYGHPEPYGRNVQQVYVILDGALDRAMLEPNTPASEILAATAREMDQKLLGYKPPEQREREEFWAAMIAGFVGLMLLGLMAWGIVRWWKGRNVPKGPEPIPAGLSRKRIYTIMGACLAPAMLFILVWEYYPLGRGLVIAFQDYRVMGGATWNGLQNFIDVFTQPIFWRSVANSFTYMALVIGLGFFLPVGLALALNEIPRFKVFFRVLFFLPAMTSPILIAFLWRGFYDRSETGILNQLLRPIIEAYNNVAANFGREPIPLAHDWLGDPRLAMFAVVLPAIWAAAGPGSILYLAALKSIPEERYEAADIDGASWWQKLWYITLPGLKPLILINLLGAFIAGFKAMENVFVLTLGGPLYATHTMGLEVWTNAFMFLNFGYATAAAWVMGSILIGFTLLQIRYLTRLRYRAAGVQD
jgi:multiple sugar transport system permease protein